MNEWGVADEELGGELVPKDLGYTGGFSFRRTSLFPTFVFPEESAAFFEGAVMLGDV